MESLFGGDFDRLDKTNHWRVRLLKEQGTIPEVIECQKDYLPLTTNMRIANN